MASIHLRRFLADPAAAPCWGILFLSFGAWLWIYQPLIPANGIGLGHDYSLHLPHLLAGYYWFLQNGFFAVPWFTPAQCGGLPYLADPATSYYTLPQWLAFAMSPVSASRASFAIFAGLGAAGCYALLRGRFEVSAAAATAAAVLFLYSGFSTYRMAIGQFGFHAHVLVPWVAWAVLTPGRNAGSGPAAAVAAAWAPLLAGGFLAYMLQAGMIHVLPCAVLAVAALLLVHGEMRGHRLRPWTLLAVACAIAAMLGASRAVAMLAFLANFPRSHLTLPGFPEVWDLIRVVMMTLFWRIPADDAFAALGNRNVFMGQHEWEFGPGPAALALLVAGALAAAARLRSAGRPAWTTARSLPALIALAVILAMPLLLNWYQPYWNGVLKQLPYFRSSSNLVRWFALYVPVVAVLGGLALERVAPGARIGPAAAALVAAVTIAWNASADKSYYVHQSYNAPVIEAAWHRAHASGTVRPISEITIALAVGGVIVTTDRNNALAFGRSQLACYQPVFGYRLENFPFRPLRPGPTLGEAGPGVLNVKNPACYVFPDENSCSPGSHFRTDQRADAARFLDYEPFPFVRPLRQKIADHVSLAALCLVAAVLAWSVFYALRTGPGSRITRHP